MTTYNEPVRPLEFLVSEGEGQISREKVSLAASSGELTPGWVLGKRLTGGAAVATANAGNTGTGTFGAITVTGPAKVGVYNLVIIEPGTDAGKFAVTDPDGKVVGTGTVAVAFSKGGLAFTLSDATDFVAGDGFTIAVTGSDVYDVYDNTATDGTQTAVAILGYPAPNSGSAQDIMVISRLAEVQADELDWGDNDAAGILQGTADLATRNIIVRAA